MPMPMLSRSVIAERCACRAAVLAVALAGLMVRGVLGADPIVDRIDPERWVLWRCGPLPLPTSMSPHDPELLPLGPPIDFGESGSDLIIVLPEAEATAEGPDGAALRGMVRLIRKKTPRAETATLSSLTPGQKRKQLLVLGTPADVDAERIALGSSAGRRALAGFGPGGYRLTHGASPFAAGKRIILGIGSDGRGVWAAAAILAFAIHPQAERLGELRPPWPVRVGDGTYWAPFDAENPGEPAGGSERPRPAAGTEPPVANARPRPRVPFGVRIWGSPMPTLPSYRRLVRALAGLAINTIVVQPGGWPDTPDCGATVAAAVDAAWNEGLATVMYAGNEIEAHRPAPLTGNHKAIVAAIGDHPGLLGWHLYNQLAATLTPAERDLVREQMQWLGARTRRPLANEIVWGHNLVEPPADKIALIEDLKRWGMTALATDYAPIGGWTRDRDPDLGRWEGRLRAAGRFGLPLEAVLQAHVPFLDPRVPRDVELRNQYWWALAGGARAFYFECAYNFTHFSNRGLLTWDLNEQSDGRCAEMRRLAEVTRRLEPLIAEGQPDTSPVTAALGLTLAPAASGAPGDAGDVALRVRRTPDGTRWLLLVNRALDAAYSATIALADAAPALIAEELVPGSGKRPFAPGRPLVAQLPPGGGACFRLSLSDAAGAAVP
jgi:hypothetical protein